jgi:hypothetical protein
MYIFPLENQFNDFMNEFLNQHTGKRIFLPYVLACCIPLRYWNNEVSFMYVYIYTCTVCLRHYDLLYHREDLFKTGLQSFNTALMAVKFVLVSSFS